MKKVDRVGAPNKSINFALPEQDRVAAAGY